MPHERPSITIEVTASASGWDVTAHRHETGEMRVLTTPRPLNECVSVVGNTNSYRTLAGALRAIGANIDHGRV